LVKSETIYSQNPEETRQQNIINYSATHVKLENCPRLTIEVSPTTFHTETLTLTYSPMRAMAMTHTHAQGQRSRGSTAATVLPPVLMQLVIRQIACEWI